MLKIGRTIYQRRCIYDPRGDGVSAVGGEGGCSAPGEGRVVDDGIGEEVGAVVELERFTHAQCCADGGGRSSWPD